MEGGKELPEEAVKRVNEICPEYGMAAMKAALHGYKKNDYRMFAAVPGLFVPDGPRSFEDEVADAKKYLDSLN